MQFNSDFIGSKLHKFPDKLKYRIPRDSLQLWDLHLLIKHQLRCTFTLQKQMKEEFLVGQEKFTEKFKAQAAFSRTHLG